MRRKKKYKMKSNTNRYPICKVKGCKRRGLFDGYCKFHKDVNSRVKSYKDYLLEAKKRDKDVRAVCGDRNITDKGFLSNSDWGIQTKKYSYEG